MRYLIITVAGIATRFNRDTMKETLKCLYYTDSPKYTLLYMLLKNCGVYDKYIIVGGYLYGQLESFVAENLKEYKDKIILVYNNHFKDYGSGYSLYKGIEAVEAEDGNVTFVEGDLFFEKSNFDEVYYSQKNVITINREPIFSSKAVVLYVSEDGKLHYLYDTSHKTLFIREPFAAIFNSGQMWKFVSISRLKAAVAELTEKQLQGTNLEIIQAYFKNLNHDEYNVVIFDKWFNCNTVADYSTVRKLM